MKRKMTRLAFAGKRGPAATPFAARRCRTMPGISIEPAAIERRNWRRGKRRLLMVSEICTYHRRSRSAADSGTVTLVS